MRICINTFIVFLFLIGINNARSQAIFFDKNIQSPKISHFSRNDFKSDAQFWDMTSDAEGVLYFGNNDGVIIFDGEFWKKVNLPNSSSVRSLCTGKNGTVYAGGFNELGVINKDSTGTYMYQSLTDRLNLDDRNLENIWQAHAVGDLVVFRTFSELIVFNKNAATHLSTNSRFTHSGVVAERLFIQEQGSGIMQFDPNVRKLELVFKNEAFNGEEITAFLPLETDNNLLLIAKSGNLYKADVFNKKVVFWKSIFNKGQRDQVITALKKNGQFFLGTLSSKIIVLDETGSLAEKVNYFDNVFDSTVLNMFEHKGDLWVLLNNGLDFIDYNAPVTSLFDQASIYDILIRDTTIYLATNRGVYRAEKSNQNIRKTDFKRINGLEGPAWSIQEESGSIIVSHDRGLFILNDDQVEKIDKANGFWKIIPISDLENRYLATNYNGIYLLTKKDNNWQLSAKIEGFDESTRDIAQAEEENSFWVCHGYQGVYKIKFNADYSRIYSVDHYTDKNGFSSPFNINVRRWKGSTVFTTNTGVYTFNYAGNTFEPFTPLNKILDSTLNTRQLIQKGERTWVVQDDEVAYFDKSNPRDLHKNLFLNLKGNLNKGMERILPIDSAHVLIGAKTGLFLYDLMPGKAQKNIDTKITEAYYLKGEVLKKLPIHTSDRILVPNETAIFSISFASPQMSPKTPIEYSYRLNNAEDKWSAWTLNPTKEYTRLVPGDYTFEVKSRNFAGVEGQKAALKLYVPALWYQTVTAIVCYITLFFLCILITYTLVKKKIKTERRKSKVEAYKSKKLLELEIEQLKLMQDRERIQRDKEMLEEDNIEKSKELANFTMLLVKKKDIFSDTYTNLKEFRKTLNTQPAKKRLNDVLSKLNQHRIGEEYMRVFDVNFEKVHKNFFKALKDLDPNLSKRELRLCAFVKMNLTNKEIAPLLNISVRGVETARYRVRKKLDVHETSFQEFLQNLSHAPAN